MATAWKMFLAEGIILVILGIAAVVLPFAAGLVITIFLGWLFLLAGVVGLVSTFGSRQGPGFVWSLLSALLALIAAGLLLWSPIRGLITLTYLLIAYFVVDGVFTIVFAIEHRRELSARWHWLLVNGLVDLVLAAIIVSGLPDIAAWALGIIVGIDMLFGGGALITMALAARPKSA
jgi:uncharacterized membrane protein HdeD (DUF308 family)